MDKYFTFFGILLLAFVPFQKTEGKIETDGGDTVVIVDNLKIHGINGSCNTVGDIQYCCIGIESKVNFTDTACVSIEYLRKEIGFELNVTIEGYLLYHEKISVRNPPPMCFHVPYLEKIANVCFRVTDLDLDKHNNTISGCVLFEGHIEGLKLFKIDLGCFKIPLLFVRNEVNYSVRLVEENK